MDWFLYDNSHRHERVKRQSCHHIETSQLICRANYLTGFYTMTTLEFNELNRFTPLVFSEGIEMEDWRQ